ncbi:MAG: FAD-binding protein [Ardenticatenaceae bacterium]|nr:FAD-binding protein [Ardenticatenaceae bacterium]HBY95904.1 hypothetical protein [Chloroflexota bacterium]
MPAHNGFDGDHIEIETDVVIIGGGLAGCFAAIKARNAGADVVLFDKAAIKRSGNASYGDDHVPIIAFPGLTIDPEELAERALKGMDGLVDPQLSYILAEEGIHRALDLNEYGVPVFYEGNKFLFVPSRYELGLDKGAKWSMIFLKGGGEMKECLAHQVRLRGVKVIEHTIGNSVLTHENRVVGATGVNIRTGEFIVCKAKAVVLCTGSANRLYWSPEGLMANYYCPTNCGDGHAIAYRAGARLTGMEFIQAQTHTTDHPAGPRPHGFFTVLVNAEGENIQRKWEHLTNQLDAITMAAYDEYGAGRVPYWNTDTMSPHARDMWAYGLANEHPIGLKYTDPKRVTKRQEARTRIFGLYRSVSGPIVDAHMHTSLRGLFGAGDTINSSRMGGNTNAFVTGARAGHFAAVYARTADKPVIDQEQVKAEKARVYAYDGRERGIKPIELEETVRRIIYHYVGIRKSEPQLRRGLEVLHDVTETFGPQVAVTNPHELMRYLELQNIIQVAEILFEASLFREESRIIPSHWRIDFPNQDDENWKLAVIAQQADDRLLLTAEHPDRWMRRV